MKRSIQALVVAAVAFFAMAASASAHVVTVASGGVTCSGVTASWAKFPAGPFDLNVAFQDTANGKAVTSPYLVEHLTGPSGSQAFAAPALAGVTHRTVTITWTADGGGSVTTSATVKCCKQPPTTTTTQTQTTGTTTTVTTPGQTTTTPGQTVTVTKTVTTPGQTVTVTTPGPTTTVMVPGPTTTVMTPGPTKTVIVHRKSKPKVVTKMRLWPINVICPKGYSGSYSVPFGKKGKPIVAICKRIPHSVQDTGVTG